MNTSNLKPLRRCSIDGCGHDVKANGLCNAHNARLMRGQDLHTPIRRRASRVCAAQGCMREYHANSYCAVHYRRVRSGKPIDGHPPRELWRENHATGCWDWVARLDKDGYGVVDRRGRGLRAHRWSYEHHIGSIPPGMTIDHVCFNRRCVNPAHLRPLSHAENARRQREALKTHCVAGHEFTPDNTYRRPDRPGARECRTCIRLRSKRYADKSKAPS